MIRFFMLYLLSSFSLVYAGDGLVAESNGCVIESHGVAGFSVMKSDEGVTFLKYKYKDGRIENVRVRCKGMMLEDAVSNEYVQEKDGLKFGTGSEPLAKAERIYGGNWSGVEATYFLDSACFTTSFEAGKEHVFSINVCGDDDDINEFRKNFLNLLKHSETHYAEVEAK
ncbi:hypothetical protein M5G22_21610 [Pseudomonas sp. TNT2022 ID233]|uniref:hypothetical protein n=1 Tax=Pseudomonas aphyarum TaxID=2942629 RepID=UPI002361F78D|nr:hypothetical protein [Pseudomonas aphyarum]MDD1140167.1 hypothetical protein [Pseudomonas aphyarum]